MTTNYRDATTYVDTGKTASSYEQLDYLNEPENPDTGSLLSMHISQDSKKYFSTNPTFEKRLDNVRIAPPNMMRVSLGNDYVSGKMSSEQRATMSAAMSDYAVLGQSTYKLYSN